MTTLTLKNFPDSLHDRLRVKARLHRRSVNQEAIHQLERALGGVDDGDLLTRIRHLRERTPGLLTDAELLAFRDEGRR